MKKIGLMTLIFLLLTLRNAWPGVVIEQRVKDGEGRASQVILSCSENQLRSDHLESGLTMIMDLQADQIILIDHRSKNYVQLKLSLWEKQMAEQLRKDNPGLRPKERTITVKRSGEKAVLNGFGTEKIEVFADGERIEEHWMTREIDLSEVDRATEKASQGLSKVFLSELKEGQEIQKKLKPYGFSILVKDYAITHGLGAVDVLEVKKIEKKELKKEVFQPPGGYERLVPQPTKK